MGTFANWQNVSTGTYGKCPIRVAESARGGEFTKSSEHQTRGWLGHEHTKDETIRRHEILRIGSRGQNECGHTGPISVRMRYVISERMEYRRMTEIGSVDDRIAQATHN
jgi:hypothetical protein